MIVFLSKLFDSYSIVPAEETR